MKIGFVYILLNPAFPQYVKIGRTSRNSEKRADELSRQTGVPKKFVVIYEELVTDSVEVEKRLHSRFQDFRNPRKEFFQVPIKEAIKALQEEAKLFSLPLDIPSLTCSLFSYFKENFGLYLKSEIFEINLIQLPDICYLETLQMTGKRSQIIIEREEIPLHGILSPSRPYESVLQANVDLIKTLDEYDLIMVTNLFTEVAAQEIAQRWEAEETHLS